MSSSITVIFDYDGLPKQISVHVCVYYTFLYLNVQVHFLYTFQENLLSFICFTAFAEAEMCFSSESDESNPLHRILLNKDQ